MPDTDIQRGMVSGRPKVLLVDDEPRNLDVLEAMLEPLDCDLIRAQSADEALLHLLRHEFAAIVLDIRMPGMGGLELATVIKQRKRTQDVPILFLTALVVEEADVLRGYGVGAVDYLSKPVNAEILRSKVGVFIELYRKTRALEALNEALQREVANREEAQEALRRANQELEERVRERTAELRLAVQERERLLRDAREARDAAEAASRAKDEFLAMLSHELRNPLNVIAAGIAVLDKTGSQDAQTARTRQLISKQVQHLAHLIDDLLDISRVTSGKVALNRRPLDLGATVTRCLATVDDAAGPGPRAWRTSLEPVWIDGDETRIEQIVTNLLANAMRFTPDGGRIDVAVAVDEDDAVLRVADTGVGIAAELLPRVFDLFVQGDRSVDRSKGGLGLGLTLVRRLTELHGGSVAAESDGPGRGASFTVRFPRRTAMAKPAVDTPASPFTAGQRILVVEDNADARELLRMMLELQGHEVHDAPDGESAISKAMEVRPQTAIIDIGLPGIDGFAVAARLRAMDPGLAAMRLIALTGYGADEHRRRSAEVGFDAHLTKPVEPERLTQVLSIFPGAPAEGAGTR